jgi:leucyl-tRNA---protein transferase
MTRILGHFVEAPRPCSYLDDQAASLEHKFMFDVGPDEVEALLERGWRRFGADYFRPACADCEACVPTRIVVGEFSPTKSQRRARRSLESLRATVGPPTVDEERLALYHAWHGEREGAREWAPSTLDAREYALQFALPHPCAREVSYRDDAAPGRLVAVALCDETPRAWSLVYCFYDPAYKERSLGTANVVMGVQIAAQRGLPHVYLGYAVAANASLRYKSTFNPREVLVGRPGAREAPHWVRVPARAKAPS